MSLVAWRLLRGDATTGRAVLCVDFTQARVRAQAGFADLAAALPDHRFAVWGTDEGAWHSTTPAPEGVPAHPDGGVAGVFGYCAGAALACALAGRVARATGTAPPVVLFDPAVVTAQTLLEQHDAALRGLAGVAPEPDLAAAREAAQTDARTGTDLGGLAAALTRRYADLARPACAAQRVPESIADQLCGRLEAYLRYLVRSAAAPLDHPGAATVVVSATFRPPPSLEHHPLVRTGATQAGLLADPAASGAAARALAGAGSGEWLAAAP